MGNHTYGCFYLWRARRLPCCYWAAPCLSFLVPSWCPVASDIHHLLVNATLLVCPLPAAPVTTLQKQADVMFSSDILTRKPAGSVSSRGQGCARLTDPRSLKNVFPAHHSSNLVSEVSGRGRCVPCQCFTLRPAVRTNMGPTECIMGCFYLWHQCLRKRTLFSIVQEMRVFPTDKVTELISQAWTWKTIPQGETVLIKKYRFILFHSAQI